MSILQRRMLTYLCLSLALALAAPLVTGPDKQHQQQNETQVFLSALALSPQALARACCQGPYPLADEVLKKYPAIRKAIGIILKRGPEWGAVSLRGPQPPALVRSLGGQKAQAVCFTHLKRIYLLKLGPWRGMARLWAVGVAPGVDLQVPRITRDLLVRYPALARYLESLKPLPRTGDRLRQLRRQIERLKRLGEGTSSPSRFYKRVASPLTVQDWRALLAQLDLDDKLPVFRWGDFVIMGREESRSRRVAVPVPGLFPIKLAAALVLALLGLWWGRGIYRQGPGITVNPVWAGVFGDVIFILALGFGALGLVQYLQVRWLGTIPLSFMDEALQVICSLMYLPCLLIMAWFVSNFVGQSLEVKPEGLVWHGPGGFREMAWDDILGFELKESNLLVSRGGVVLPRRLQTLLVIKTEQGDVLLFEPGLRSTKKKIVGALEEMAPARLQADIQRLAQEW